MTLPDPPAGRYCNARTRSGGRCRQRPVSGRARCRMHGGVSPRGPAHPAFKHGRYSRALPENVLGKYNEIVSDQSILDGREEIALLQLRIEELAARARAGAHVGLWQEATAAMDEVFRLMAGPADEPPERRQERMAQLGAAVGRLRGALTTGRDSDRAWAELSSAIEFRSRLASREWRRLAEMQALFSADQVRTLLAGILEVLRRHVPTSILVDVSRDVSRLIGPGVSAGLDADRGSGRAE